MIDAILTTTMLPDISKEFLTRMMRRKERGFHEVYSSVQEELLAAPQEELGKHPGASVVVSGHSLGAALAVMRARHLHSSASCKPFCFSFNTPMVGNLHFVLSHYNRIGCHWTLLDGEEGRFPRMLNFVRKSDPVSWGRHGFKDHSAQAVDKRRKIASDTDVVTKALKATLLKKDKKQYFYQTPNLVYMGWLPILAPGGGTHDYTATQKTLMGQSLFN